MSVHVVDSVCDGQYGVRGERNEEPCKYDVI